MGKSAGRQAITGASTSTLYSERTVVVRHHGPSLRRENKQPRLANRGTAIQRRAGEHPAARLDERAQRASAEDLELLLFIRDDFFGSGRSMPDALGAFYE